MQGDAVADDELLYRRVKAWQSHFKQTQSGVRVSSQAFSDRNLRPSVDRALLNCHDPSRTQESSGDLVVSVWAHQVRTLTVQRGTDDICPADVEPKPTPANPAHAEVFLLAPHNDRRVFDKVIERLAQLSRWVIGPPATLPSDREI